MKWLVVALSMAAFAQAYTTSVPARQERCFHELMQAGEQLLVGFQVQDGPDYEVDFWIKHPDGRDVISMQRSMGYEHNVDATQNGRYTFCFRNNAASDPPKTLSFYTYREDIEHVNRVKGLTDPIDIEIEKLQDGLRAIREDQQHLVYRERVHRDTAESTNARVKWWSLFEMVMLVGVCGFQVFYLKRFFEVRRSF